jgi:hypothetical protein
MVNDILFVISPPFEYAKKLDREYERLSSSIGKKNENQVDHALNFSLAAWHLADRVFNYPDTKNTLKEKGIEDWGAFQTRIFSLCPELRICHDLANSFKHYNDNRNTAKTVKSAAQVSEGGNAKNNGVPIFINSGNNSSVELIVELTDGTKLNFMDIAGAVIAFWQKELESLKT